MKVLELYSGIGGMHYALQESTIRGNVVAAVDINTVANDVYRYNFPNIKVFNRNIQSMSAAEINNFEIDTILMSPPCQPFTRVGLQKDLVDERCASLLHVITLIPEMKTLKYILLENVKGFENSDARNKLVECLERNEFKYKELILSPCQFGIPNTRHRYYLLAKKQGLKFRFSDPALECSLANDVLRILPLSKHQQLADLDDIINVNTNKKCYKLDHIIEDGDLSKHLIPQTILNKRAWILDIKTYGNNATCCFTKAYGHYVEGTGSVFCPFSDSDVSKAYNECEKYTKGSTEQLHILENLRLRYFTPKEVSRLMCFPDTFIFPKNTTDRQKYRLLGNSINVYVTGILIYLLYCEEENT